MSPPDRKHRLRVAAAVVGTLLASGWVLQKVDLPDVGTSLTRAHLGWWGLAVMLVPVQTLLAAERWHVVSRRLHLPLTRRAAWTEFALSSAINQLLPGGIAGDSVRVWRQRRRQQGMVGALRAAVADRWWGQTVLAASVLLGTLLWPATIARPAGLGAGVCIAALGVGLVWGLPERIPALGRLGADLRLSARSPAPFLLGLALMLAILAGFAACGLAIGVSPGWWLVSAAPLALLAASIPVSLGGWGLREGSLVALLPLFGTGSADALALSLLFGLAFLVGTLPGLLVLLLPTASESP